MEYVHIEKVLVPQLIKSYKNVATVVCPNEMLVTICKTTFDIYQPNFFRKH
jgi:hypothetical protein